MDWRIEYPFCSRRLSIDGWDCHYVDEGQGQPLLMVHGNPTWSFYWRHLIAEFRNEFRTIAPDHIGCGLSDKPQQYNYTLSQHIQNLVRLIDELDLQGITLLAHDWGGAIGMGAALQRPGRFSRFILFNTAAFPPPFFPWRIRICRTPWLGQWALQGANLFARAALRMAVDRPRNLTASFKSGMIVPYDSWQNRVAIYRFVKDIPHCPKHPTWETLEQIEASLSNYSDDQFCFIWGMKDWCFRPSCLEKFLSILPNATVERIDDAGHWVIEEAKDRVAAAVRSFVTSRIEPQDSKTQELRPH